MLVYVSVVRNITTTEEAATLHQNREDDQRRRWLGRAPGGQGDLTGVANTNPYQLHRVEDVDEDQLRGLEGVGDDQPRDNDVTHD